MKLKLFLTILLINNIILASDVKTVPEKLQEVAVTVKSGNGEGSGVIVTKKDKNGDSVNFVLTAAHVVADLRSEREIVSSEGAKKTVVEFKDAKVIKVLVEEGRTVGRLELDAEVIKYSEADNGDDLSLLKLRKKNFVNVSIDFYMEDKIPVIGTELFHVGSLLGQMGANSMTAGIVSQIGRLHEKKIFDQSTCAAFPGSSGGIITLRDGRYIGMLVRGAGETFNLYVPMRRIKSWADRNDINWLFDPNKPAPNEEELSKLPIEGKVKTKEEKVVNK